MSDPSGPSAPALAAAARFGLDPPSGPAVELGDDTDARWQMVTRIDRLGGLMWSAIDAGRIVADAAAVDRVAEIRHSQLIASVVVEELVVRTAEVLDAANVSWRLMKGAAVAHLDYPGSCVAAFRRRGCAGAPRALKPDRGSAAGSRMSTTGG